MEMHEHLLPIQGELLAQEKGPKMGDRNGGKVGKRDQGQKGKTGFRGWGWIWEGWGTQE